ncbi:28 kDa ribonucleoprotein, chloroplastic-like [Neltuma alba]|uniref:28 kDa ribonucleoprotein, chloroplastic-like n=1 Tax=Neltuma alba TaxID=207710 RepID=UPI0010A3B80E|nr:28 kDa ribonucleoprotein, chloroplastic-like [Prosopis alba]XP_028793356.1 28 kDa ribonucleoprotein, chloroplastic-like [Prosopis alba]
MAASAAAAIGSSFSSSINTLKCLRSSKNLPSEPLLRISSNRVLASVSLSHLVEPLSFDTNVNKLWVSRVSTQEELVVVDEIDAGLVEENKEGEEEVVEEGEAEEGSVNTKLYFGNLPYSVDSAQLAAIIQDYGSPELIEVLYNRETGKSRGFAFVTMSSVEDCNAVIENLDGTEFLGRSLRVNFSDKPKPKLPLYPETEHKLFVGNLSWSVTSESLTQAFQEYGRVVGARVLYDGETGRSRGYGFVCYSTRSEMEAALSSMNGVELEGREMRVSLAEGKRSQSQ